MGILFLFEEKEKLTLYQMKEKTFFVLIVITGKDLEKHNTRLTEKKPIKIVQNTHCQCPKKIIFFLNINIVHTKEQDVLFAEKTIYGQNMIKSLKKDKENMKPKKKNGIEHTKKLRKGLCQ